MASAPIDIPVKVKGLSDLQKLERRMQALEKEVTRLQKVAPKAANNIRKIGPAGKLAAGGMKAFGAATKAALGPIGAALAAIGGLTAAFNVLKNQDFAEAKFESLGGDADQLVTNLKAVSNELQGQRSVVELTAASYDVASAGFNSAAEASLVLKAASQGATGGFADLNTVANATTSVLNAYQMSAAEATTVVDQFIQTQNDGKIVVAEYAANIGKVAAAAAGLGVPLSEVNAVIAQSTASGVQAEVAFTGLKGALARLASGEASKALEDFGINIDAASIEADGLLGTLKKLEGLDTGTLFKALGTEAAPALLPIIQNLERYEELVRNQEDANGVAAAAAATAAGTIEGAWKRVTTAVQNLFSDTSELGQGIRAALLIGAATVEALAAAFKLLIAPIRAVLAFLGEVAGAWTGVESGEAVLQSITALWFDALAAAEDFGNTVIAVGKVLGQYVGSVVQAIKGIFAGLWNSISSGVQSVIPAITGAFSRAFNAVKGMIEAFWNSLPPWLRGALEAAGSVAGGIVTAVSGALQQVKGDIDAAKAQVEITVPDAPNIPSFTPTTAAGGGGGSGGGGGGGAGDAERLAKEAQRRAAQMAEGIKKAERMVELAQLEQNVLKETTEIGKIKAAAKIDELKTLYKFSDLYEEALSDEERAKILQAQGLEITNDELKLEQELKNLRESAIKPIDDEIALLTAKIQGKEEEYKIAKMIADLEGKGVENADAKVRELFALREQAAAVDELKASYESLANSIASNLTGAFKDVITGAKSAEEALSDAFAGIADAFLNMAMQMIQEWIKMQLLGIVSSAFGGGGAAAGGGLASGLGAGGSFSFAEGGYVTSPTPALVGEGGEPEYVIPQSKMDSAMMRWSAGQSGGQVLADGGEMVGGGGTALADQPPQINISGGTTVINNEEFIRMDQLPSIIAQSAQAGEAKTLRRLRMSPGTRRQTGI